MTVNDLREGCALPMEDARALPFSAYSDPNVMNLELDRIFRREWIAVCPEIALSAKGDYTTIEIAGEPIAVVRGQDGELRALSNVCRHRGSPLLEGTGNLSANIVCPYHAWAYDDRGEMKGAPQTGAVVIDRAAHCLPTFRLEVWSGIVFVNLDAEAEPLAPEAELLGSAASSRRGLRSRRSRRTSWRGSGRSTQTRRRGRSWRQGIALMDRQVHSGRQGVAKA